MSVPRARTDVIETQSAPTHTGTTRARAGGVSKATDTSVIVSTTTSTNFLQVKVFLWLNYIAGFRLGYGLWLMMYSHWLERTPEQGPKTSGLYETVWMFSHYTWRPRPIVPHCSGPDPCSCLGHGSAQCEYTIKLQTGLLHCTMQKMFTLHGLGLGSLLPISAQYRNLSPSPNPYPSPTMCLSH